MRQEGPPFIQRKAGEQDKDRVGRDEGVKHGKCIHTLTGGSCHKDSLGSGPTPSHRGTFHFVLMPLVCSLGAQELQQVVH